jgi:hypothetical protein
MQYYSEHNDRPMGSYHSHDQRQVYWDLDCGCELWKSPHAVMQNMRRHGGLEHATCFKCPLHDCMASAWAMHAYALVHAACFMRAHSLVFEAAVLRGHGPFDMYLPDLRLLMEVDGEGHSRMGPNGRRSKRPYARQQAVDHAKNQAGGGRIHRIQ